MLLSAVEKSKLAPAFTRYDATACRTSPTAWFGALKETRSSLLNGVLFAGVRVPGSSTVCTVVDG